MVRMCVLGCIGPSICCNEPISLFLEFFEDVV